MARLFLAVAAFAACGAFVATPSIADPLPPSTPGTPQPVLDQAGRASPTTITADTDYGFLRSLAPGPQWSDRLKNIPLASSGDIRLSFSAIGYLEAEFFRDQNFGQFRGSDWFQNQRLNVYGDVNFGDRLRIFGALKHGDRNGFRGFVPPVERDALDLHQAFVELRFGDALGLNVNDAFIRVGRQELHYGAGRMISIRQGPNVRLDFDGGLLRLRSQGIITDAFAAFDVSDRPGVFDNRTDTNNGVWGLYATLPMAARHNLDLYYMGDRRTLSPFVQGAFAETRHSIGARWWLPRGPSGGWSGDIEATYQFGTGTQTADGRADITAWSVSGQTSYGWPQALWSPVATMTAGLSSGDGNPLDGRLGTFRAPNPPGRYFGETTPFGPGNLVGGGVSLALSPIESFTIEPSVDLFWRADTNDGIYTPGGAIVRPAGGNNRFVGWEAGLTTRYQINPNLAVRAEAGYFFPGGYLADNPPARNVARFMLGLDFGF
jgi:hypothetical protein